MSNIINYVKRNAVPIVGTLAVGGAIGATAAINAQPLGALCLYQPTNTNYCIKPGIHPGNKCLPIPGLVKRGTC